MREGIVLRRCQYHFDGSGRCLEHDERLERPNDDTLEK